MSQFRQRDYIFSQLTIEQGANCVHFGPGDENSNTYSADESVGLDQIRDAGVVVAMSVREMAAYS